MKTKLLSLAATAALSVGLMTSAAPPAQAVYCQRLWECADSRVHLRIVPIDSQTYRAVGVVFRDGVRYPDTMVLLQERLSPGRWTTLARSRYDGQRPAVFRLTVRPTQPTYRLRFAGDAETYPGDSPYFGW